MYLMKRYNTYYYRTRILNSVYVKSLKTTDKKKALQISFLMNLYKEKIMEKIDMGEYGKTTITALIDFLAESRAKGFASIVATQSLEQFEELVGRKVMLSLLQMLNTKIVLQYDSPDGQKIICDYIGKNRLEVQKEGFSEGDSPLSGNRRNYHSEEKTEEILLTSELSSLPQLHAFVKTGQYPLTLVRFDIVKTRTIAEEFIPRDVPFFEIAPDEKTESGGKVSAIDGKSKQAEQESIAPRQLGGKGKFSELDGLV